jgi:hypothetical protein
LSETTFDNKLAELLLQNRPLKALRKLSLRSCLKLTTEGVNALATYAQNLCSLEEFDLTMCLIASQSTAFFTDEN